MSIQHPARSSTTVVNGPRHAGMKPPTSAAAPVHVPNDASVEPHGYPERQPGIGYGRSSGYVSRDAYKAAGRYSQSAGPSLFRFH